MQHLLEVSVCRKTLKSQLKAKVKTKVRVFNNPRFTESLKTLTNFQHVNENKQHCKIGTIFCAQNCTNRLLASEKMYDSDKRKKKPICVVIGRMRSTVFSDTSSLLLICIWKGILLRRLVGIYFRVKRQKQMIINDLTTQKSFCSY